MEFLTHVEPLHMGTKQLDLQLLDLHFLQPLFLMTQLSQPLHIQETVPRLVIHDEQGSLGEGLLYFHKRDLEIFHLTNLMY